MEGLPALKGLAGSTEISVGTRFKVDTVFNRIAMDATNAEL